MKFYSLLDNYFISHKSYTFIHRRREYFELFYTTATEMIEAGFVLILTSVSGSSGCINMWALIPPESCFDKNISMTLILLKDREATLLTADSVMKSPVDERFFDQSDAELRGFVSEGLASLTYECSYNPMLYPSGYIEH